MADTVDPVPEHLHTITPRLVFDDAAAAIEFYRAAFGAEKLGEPLPIRTTRSCTPRSASATPWCT